MSRQEFIRKQEWRYRAFREQRWTSIQSSPQFQRQISSSLVYPLENNKFERILEEQSHEEWEKRNNNKSILCRSYAGRRKLVISLRELPIEQYYSTIDNKHNNIKQQRKQLINNNNYQQQNKINQQFYPSQQFKNEEYSPSLIIQPKQNIIYEYGKNKEQIGRRESNCSSSESSNNSKNQRITIIPLPPPPSLPLPSIQLQKKKKQKQPIFIGNTKDVEQLINEENEEEEEEEIKKEEIIKEKPLKDEKNLKKIKEPEQEVINETNGFRIKVEAKEFDDNDFRVYIDAYRVLALDGEHIEDNKDGTMTVKKLNRRWKLGDDVDLHSVKAYLTSDGNVEISGNKLLNKEQNIIEEEEEEEEENNEEEEEDKQIINNLNEEINKKIIQQKQQQNSFNNKNKEWINNGNEIYFK